MDARLAAAKVEPSAEPHDAWQRLRGAEGRRTTIIDLYELVARQRGQAGSDWEREHLLFRDYLRRHSDARDAYARVKEEAAQVWSDDRIAYTEAKAGVILDLLDAAEAWATANSWTVAHPPR